MLTSKRHGFKIYGTVFFTSFLFLAFAISSSYAFFNYYDKSNLQTKNYFLPIISIACLAMSLYTIYRYFKNAPIIELGNNGIKIKSSKRKSSFAFSDIEKIDITGKVPFEYVLNFPMEGITITLNNGKIIYVFDDMYSNAWQIKSYLNDVVINKCEPKEHNEIEIDKSIIDYEFMQLFKGTQLISFRGIVLWVPIGFLVFVFFFIKNFNPPNGLYIFFLIYGVFWFLFNSYLMHYFGIDKDYLVIRNHNLMWINRIYQIQDIEEVVFETRNKMPNMLRLITKNFKSKIYPASTLRKRDWLALKEELEKRNVTVRNEAFLSSSCVLEVDNIMILILCFVKPNFLNSAKNSQPATH